MQSLGRGHKIQLRPKAEQAHVPGASPRSQGPWTPLLPPWPPLSNVQLPTAPTELSQPRIPSLTGQPSGKQFKHHAENNSGSENTSTKSWDGQMGRPGTQGSINAQLLAKGDCLMNSSVANMR